MKPTKFLKQRTDIIKEKENEIKRPIIYSMHISTNDPSKSIKKDKTKDDTGHAKSENLPSFTARRQGMQCKSSHICPFLHTSQLKNTPHDYITHIISYVTLLTNYDL